MMWLWLREDRSLWLGLLGAAVSLLYGILPTLPSTSPEPTQRMADCLPYSRCCGANWWTASNLTRLPSSERLWRWPVQV